MHVTLRVVDAVRGLRRRAMYHAIREATLVAARNAERFRIVHLSIQQTHVHMLVETDGKAALARGMQGFKISAAKQINAALGKERGQRRRGAVFSDRYHAEVIRVPRQARHALAYVLRGSTRIRDSVPAAKRFCLWRSRSRLLRVANATIPLHQRLLVDAEHLRC